MSTVANILLIERDEALRAAFAEQLQLNGEFLCLDQPEGEIALVLLAPAENENADALCDALRAQNIHAPIVQLGGTMAAKAVDWLPKPFRLSELFMVLRDQLLRAGKGEEDIALGAFRFRPNEKLLIDPQEERFRLTEKETAILKYLLRMGEAVTGRDELLAQVWGYNSGVTTHTLETHIYRLRKKLGQNAAGQETLITEPGGYRLIP